MSSVLIDQLTICRSHRLFNIDFAYYTLQHHQFARHFHSHFVIELVISGIDKFYCAGNEYIANPNNLVLINPGQVHTGSTIKNIPLKYYSMYPDNQTLQHVADILELQIPCYFEFQKTIQSDPQLIKSCIQLFGVLEDMTSPMPVINVLRQEEIFFQGMHCLLCENKDSFNKRKPSQDKRIALIIEFIHSHFREEVSLQKLASLVHINPHHLIRIFKCSLGISPYEYLLNLRIEYAKSLLLKNYSIQDAALKAGFYDSSHFNRLFKKISGLSPKTFRLSKSQHRTIFA